MCNAYSKIFYIFIVGFRLLEMIFSIRVIPASFSGGWDVNIFNLGSVAWSTLCVCMCVCHYNEMRMKTIKDI